MLRPLAPTTLGALCVWGRRTYNTKVCPTEGVPIEFSRALVPWFTGPVSISAGIEKGSSGSEVGLPFWLDWSGWRTGESVERIAQTWTEHCRSIPQRATRPFFSERGDRSFILPSFSAGDPPQITCSQPRVEIKLRCSLRPFLKQRCKFLCRKSI